MARMSILDAPEAQTLLEDAMVERTDVLGCKRRLESFLQRYLPLFYRKEQRETATLVISGRLSGLERKTSEPIARAAGVQRKPVQFFVGNGKWDDEAVMDQMRAHVAEELGDPEAVLVMDGSTFAKKGKESCGVGRQWSGRLGKVDNCQTGVFLAYAAAWGQVMVDRRLYLPGDWAGDQRRRDKCHVPADVVFAQKWRLAVEMVERRGPQLPHRWIVGDDEFGKVTQLRRRLCQNHERYVLDVPSRTLIRDLEARRPPRRHKNKRRRKVPFRHAQTWAARQPPQRWQRLTVRDGEQGPLVVEALERRVQTMDPQHRLGPQERLVVIRNLQDKHTDYCLSNAESEVSLSQLVQAHARRHGIEQLLQQGKQEVGLGQYECRSWIGWHHHMTLCLVSLLFLVLERRGLGKKNPGPDGVADPADFHRPVASAAPDAAADSRADQHGASSQRRNANPQMARRNRPLSTAATRQ
jgi:SRSO17 transposase